MKKILLLSFLMVCISLNLSAQELSPEGSAIYNKAVSMFDNAESIDNIVEAFNELEKIVSLPQDANNPDIYHKLGQVASVIASQQNNAEMFKKARQYYETYARLTPDDKDTSGKLIAELNAQESKIMTAYLESQIISISEATKKIQPWDAQRKTAMRQYATIYNDPRIYRSVKWKFVCQEIGYTTFGIGIVLAGCGLLGGLISGFDSNFALYTIMAGSGAVGAGLPFIFLGEIGMKSACKKSLMRHNLGISTELQKYKRTGGVAVAIGVTSIGQPGLILTF